MAEQPKLEIVIKDGVMYVNGKAYALTVTCARAIRSSSPMVAKSMLREIADAFGEHPPRIFHEGP